MLAILHVVEQYCLRGFHKIICESESQVVVNELTLQGLRMLTSLWLQLLVRLFSFSELRNLFVLLTEWNGVGDCLAKWTSDHLQDWNVMNR